MTTSDNLASIRAIAAKINKKAPNTIFVGDEIQQSSFSRITSGSLALDAILGGGWPRNKWNEIIGEPSAGKTAIVYKTIAANQALDPDYTTVWVAAEDYVPEYAAMLGVDNTRMIVIETNIMEEAYGYVVEFLGSKSVDCVVIDSLPQLTPGREDEKDVGEMNPGLGALLTGQFFRKQGPNIRRSLTEDERGVAAFMINQWREKIGVMYGDPRTTPGGKGKDFAYHIRLDVKRDEWIEIGPTGNKEKVGQVIKARTIKNKTFPPQKVATFDYYFADGNGFHAGEYDRLKEIIALGIDYEVIQRRGAFYFVADDPETKWQGRDALINALREDSALSSSVSERVLSTVLNQPTK